MKIVEDFPQDQIYYRPRVYATHPDPSWMRWTWTAYAHPRNLWAWHTNSPVQCHTMLFHSVIPLHRIHIPTQHLAHTPMSCLNWSRVAPCIAFQKAYIIIVDSRLSCQFMREVLQVFWQATGGLSKLRVFSVGWDTGIRDTIESHGDLASQYQIIPLMTNKVVGSRSGCC